MADPIRVLAMRIVVEEERAKGWRPAPVPNAAEEKRLGCDLLSHPPDGGAATRIEVKGGSQSLRSKGGGFRYRQDLRASQIAAVEHCAARGIDYRVEIVLNLAAFMRGEGRIERITMQRDYILEHKTIDLYRVPFDPLPPEQLDRFAAPSVVEAAYERAAEDAYRIVSGPGTVPQRRRRLELLARSFPGHAGVVCYFESLAMQEGLEDVAPGSMSTKTSDFPDNVHYGAPIDADLAIEQTQAEAERIDAADE